MGELYEFDYVNHAGKDKHYIVKNISWYWGTTPYYLEPQMLLKADKINGEEEVERHFAPSKIRNWKQLGCWNILSDAVSIECEWCEGTGYCGDAFGRVPCQCPIGKGK